MIAVQLLNLNSLVTVLLPSFPHLHCSDPCGNNGAFRTRAAGVLNGRISKLDIPSTTITTLALGLKNPWRFTISPSGAYIAEPGSGNYDEINGPLSLSRSPSAAPIDYGFPCYEASSPYAAYANFSTCQTLSPSAVTNPFYAYTGFNGSRISVSAVAYRAGNGRVYYVSQMQHHDSMPLMLKSRHSVEQCSPRVEQLEALQLQPGAHARTATLPAPS